MHGVKRMLHRERPDDLTVEFFLANSDTLAARTQELIPFDSPGAHSDWLKTQIENRTLNSVIVCEDGREVGMFTFAIICESDGPLRELLISTAIVESKKIGYLPIIKTVAEKIARESGCSLIRFHTVRKGMIKQALALGFYASEIVLRCPVSLSPQTF